MELGAAILAPEIIHPCYFSPRYYSPRPRFSPDILHPGLGFTPDIFHPGYFVPRAIFLRIFAPAVFYHGPCPKDGTWSTDGNSSPFPSPSSSPKTSNGPIRAKHITQWSTVIGRCGSMGLYSMGSHWSQSTWARLADRFYSTSVHFPCTQISLVLAWLSLVEISKCEETPF